ncbi:MAG: GDSL-type esterase/lipase family protein [Bacteroidales bacterium]
MKWHLIYIVSFLLSVSLFAQDDSISYLFLRRDSNIFRFWGNQCYYDSLFLKFNDLQISGEHQIRILHIGDSHVQADIFTNQIRRNFANTFFHLIGPPSIAFPYGILKSNNPVSSRLLCNGNWTAYTLVSEPQAQSLLGFTAITYDTCYSKIMFSINKKAIQNVSFNKILLFTNNDSINIILKSSSIKKQNYLILNDSIAIWQFDLNNYLDTIEFDIKLKSDSIFFVLYGLVAMNDDPGIVYHSLGINGAKATTFLNTLLPDYIKFMQYDWVIISLGTNDCYIETMDSSSVYQSFEQLIRKIKNCCPHIPILLTTPMEHYRKKNILNTNVVLIRDIMMQIAKNEHCAIWDLYNVAGGKGSMLKWYQHHLTARDKLHLNIQGYHLVGNLFFEAFMNTYLNGFLAE